MPASLEKIAELRAQSEAHEERRTAVRLPKPTLQKLGPDDDIEHFLATFERIAKQQGWPEEVWVTQLAGLRFFFLGPVLTRGSQVI